MNSRKISLALAVSLLLMPISAKAAGDGEDFKRLSGSNRYGTAKAISNYGWTTSDYVIIAQGDNFPDALCSVPLAKRYDAPILLTSKDALTKEAEEEIIRLSPKNIILIGGEGSISSKAEKYMQDKFNGAAIERIGGKDRFETSAKIAEKLGFNGEVALTSSVSFADALSLAPIAAVKEMPILLTPKDNLSSHTSNYLKGKTIDKAYIIGGTGVVSDNLKSSISNSKRIYGQNRFATNVAILKEFSNELNEENVFTALGVGPKGNEFADALSGAALAAKMNAPMILTDKTLPSEIKNYVLSDLSKEAGVFVLGGEAVVSNSIANYVNINKGQGTEVPSQAIKVESAYLKTSDGKVVNGTIESGKITLELPKGFTGKFTEVIISCSKDISSAVVAGKTIDNSIIEELYGDNKKDMDLIKYLRSYGLDPENDGLSAESVKYLNGNSVTLKDDSNSSVTYTLIIK
ncbi:cell wall-binding repeat-containing protein [Clostridium sp. BSD9I1]|uniref:cell wall-binding repeat-containing protein n=1 Tax=Clostridium sp. BSD9I1 TaxID=2003589 RepID=UPI001646A520|nr:cell wall-binding repeat-containing protein [Clostridium sp. BSD9I1]